MGLFDSLFADNPNDAAYLALASGLLSGKGNFNSVLGNSIAGAQGAYSQAKESGQKQQITKLQIEEMARRLKQQEQATADQEAFRQHLLAQGSPQMQASQQALAGGGGPTLANAAKAPAVDPRQSLMFDALKTRQIGPMDFLKMTQKDTAPLVVGRDQRVFKGGKEVIPALPKDQELPADVRTFQYAQQTPGFDEWNRLNKRSGATNVSMSTGKEGFKNELTLKTDFKSEPAYKEYQDMATAHKQIKAGISQKNPVGDLAAATKMMKLLDPTSVVRESELGMAMAATGKFDRLQNFVNLQIQGHKLTPQQRSEFGVLADELYEAAGQAYNKKRNEYEQIGKRYQLNTTGLGQPHKSSAQSGWSAVQVP